jgi:Tfp pilus assembly protein PilX
MHNKKGIILTMTVIFVMILIIVAGAALILWTNHAIITERQLRRMRAFYTAEAAIVRALDELRRTGTYPANVSLNNLTANLTYNSTNGSVNASVSY